MTFLSLLSSEADRSSVFPSPRWPFLLGLASLASLASLVPLVFLVSLVSSGPPNISHASAPQGFVLLATFPVESTDTSVSWSSNGEHFLFHHKENTQDTVVFASWKAKKTTTLWRSPNSFSPTFGPSADPFWSIFAGPALDPPPSILSKIPGFGSRKAKKDAPPPSEPSNDEAPNDEAPKDEAPDNDALPKGKSEAEKLPATRFPGIVLVSQGRSSYLFPGRKPLYSPKSRRLLFSWQGLLYFWDPSKPKKQGLLLLGKGSHARWSPDGRGLLFQREPLRFGPSRLHGGGIVLMDMFFRASSLTTVGGEAAWSSDSRAFAFVGPSSLATSPPPPAPASPGTPGPSLSPGPSLKKPTFGIFWRSLLSEAAHAELLIPEGRHPAPAPHAPWLAYQTLQGVFLYDRDSRRSRLIEPLAASPSWSPQGHLLLRSSQPPSWKLFSLSKALFSSPPRP